MRCAAGARAPTASRPAPVSGAGRRVPGRLGTAVPSADVRRARGVGRVRQPYGHYLHAPLATGGATSAAARRPEHPQLTDHLGVTGLVIWLLLVGVLAAREFVRVIGPLAERLMRPLTWAAVPLLALTLVVVVVLP